MTDPIVTPEPNDADLARIEGDAVIAHWSGDAIAIGNASRIDILNAGRRGLFNAGFAAGRATVPTRDELAEAMFDADHESWNDGTTWGKLSERQKNEYGKFADAVLAFLTTKKEN